MKPISVAVNEAIGGIFRGFVELLVEGSGKLPRFDPVAGHDRRQRPPAAVIGYILDRFALATMAERGFVEASTILDADTDSFRVRVKHRCGRWMHLLLLEQLFEDVRSQHLGELLHREFDVIPDCYCCVQERGEGAFR